MAVEVYFAIVHPQRNQFSLETRYVGTAHAYRVETPQTLAQVPAVFNRPAWTNNVIYHLIYRAGKTIVGQEPLFMPNNAQSRAAINDNPQDTVNFTRFYVGITTNFWQRACQHDQNRHGRRMYVVYRTTRSRQDTGNLERATISHFLEHPPIPTMHNRMLTNYNTQGGELVDQEFLYVLFR